MPPIARLPENRKLPARWVHKHGAFYYLPPPEVRHLWDGKSWFRLGTTLPEAYRVWAERIGRPQTVTTIGELLDRYLLEVVPTKAPKTATENVKQIARLRLVFGHMALTDLEPHCAGRLIRQSRFIRQQHHATHCGTRLARRP